MKNRTLLYGKKEFRKFLKHKIRVIGGGAAIGLGAYMSYLAY